MGKTHVLCDRCGVQFNIKKMRGKELNVLSYYHGIKSRELIFNLCEECYKSFNNFMNLKED